MKYNLCGDNRIEVVFEEDFNLRDTLLCGQCFRFFETEENEFRGVACGKELKVKQEGNKIIFFTSEEDFLSCWYNYFDLELDYGKIKEELSSMHPVLKEAAKFAPGIRILRQEPFEALISFIISQNNNIKRISGIVDKLCMSFGEEIGDGVYAFPTAKALAKLSAEDLAPLRAGFRARYIIDAARKVNSAEVDLNALNNLDYENAKKELMKIVGVGEKVADCVLLYGWHRLEGFPMDVWMKRAMKELFDGKDGREFGEYAGIAQQYIFHYSRMNSQLFE